MTTPYSCTVCSDPALCDKHRLIRPIVGRGPECRIEADDRTAFLYRILLRLAAESEITTARLNFKSRYDGDAAEAKAVTKTVSPLQVPVSEYRGLYEAVVKRLPSYRIDCNHFTNDVTTKAPLAESGFTSGNLPPILMPQLFLDLPYEPDRAFSHFKQLTAPEARAVEYIQHTGNTNPAAAVAELGTKPDLGMQLTTVTTPFVKIAAIASASTEVLQDERAFMQWIPMELQRALIDAETDEVVNGSGSSPHMGS